MRVVPMFLCLVVLMSCREMVFAQAGSTGGTVGKTDKSISGEQEYERGRSSAAKAQHVNAPQAACPLARAWSNQVSDGISSVWTISADGTATEQGRGNAHGHAVLSGRTLTITWSITISHGNYVINLNQACTAGTGKTTVLGGVSAGDVKNVTFTAVQ